MLVVCTGTATEIGKTWVGAEVLRDLGARGLPVAAYKPAQSFDPADAAPTDRDVLAAATGQAPAEVCPDHRCYPVAYAPPMAADALGADPFTVAELLAEVSWPDAAVRWLETVGGVRSPLAADGDTVTVCRLLQPDRVVLVADAGLGTINSVRLSLAALHPWPTLVHLNRYDDADDLHRRNREWLGDLAPTTTVAALADRLLS